MFFQVFQNIFRFNQLSHALQHRHLLQDAAKTMLLFRKKNEALLKSESFTTFEECNLKILLEPLLSGYVKMSGESFMLCHCIQVGCSEQLWDAPQ